MKGENVLGLDYKGVHDIILFIKKFKAIYKKEFFSDPLASFLLRELYYETEDATADDPED